MSNDYQIMLDALEKENERLRDEIGSLREAVDNRNDLLANADDEIERLQIALDACAVDNEQYEQANNALSAEIERLKGTISEILREVRGA